MRYWPLISLFMIGCSKVMPLPIGGTNLVKPQMLPITTVTLSGPQKVVAAGQSNMAYNPLDSTFVPLCRLPVTVPNLGLGGTSLASWDRGGNNNPWLINTLKADRPNVLLWYQGEADAGDPTYGARFSDWMDSLREDSGLPQLIIIYAQLGNSKGRATWDLTKSQQASIHKANTYMIKTDDVQQDIDNLHYLTTGGYNVIGQRFAEVFNTL